MIRSIRNIELRKGMVLALPFSRTATILDDPRVGTSFVQFRAEHGPTRVLVGEETLIESEETLD